MTDIRTIRKGMRGDDVIETMRFLRDAGLYPGAFDGIAGPVWESGVRMLQQYRMLDDDGRYGPQTRAAVVRCRAEDWKAGYLWKYQGVPVFGYRHHALGLIPSRGGRLSHFGGADDVDDRRYGQALLGDELHRVRFRFGDLFGLGVLRDVQEIPEGMGLSWALDTDNGFYCAMRWASSGRPSPNTVRVLAFTDDHAAGVVPTDYGPASRSWFLSRGWRPKVFDTSKACLGHLQRSTGQSARYCWAGPDVYGPQACYEGAA